VLPGQLSWCVCSPVCPSWPMTTNTCSSCKYAQILYSKSIIQCYLLLWNNTAAFLSIFMSFYMLVASTHETGLAKQACSLHHIFLWQDATLLFYNTHTFIQSHSYNTFICRNLPRPLSIYSSLVSSVGKTSLWYRAENRTRACLQQADALPTETRRTISPKIWLNLLC
jgi:hypothetical protein